MYTIDDSERRHQAQYLRDNQVILQLEEIEIEGQSEELPQHPLHNQNLPSYAIPEEEQTRIGREEI